MKKILSILLAVLVIGACATIDASAASQANVTTNESELRGKALEYFRKAQTGDAVAMYKLALCFRYADHGAKVDDNKYFYWANKASENGCPGGTYHVAQCYHSGMGVAENETKAEEWLSKAYSEALPLANNGDAVAQYVLSEYYDWKGDESQTVYWLRKAAEQGDDYAQYFLAGYYDDKDKSQMVYWYKKAAEQGNPFAQNNLAFCYASGEGVPQDYSKMEYWFIKAEENGSEEAFWSLGAKYSNIPQYYNKAVYYLRKAAEQGHCDAQNILGDMYRDGKGVKKDLTEARKWYKIAAENGSELAQENLNSLSRCTRCDGTGKVECSACDGYGETYSRPNPRESFAIKRGCRRCGGGGSKDYNAMTGEVYSDNGFYSGDGVVTCPTCHGTGQKSQTSNRNTKSNRSKRRR